MKWPFRWTLGALAVICGVALSGCTPSGTGQSEEQQEPHYLLGKRRESSLDYRGAIEAFEEALEVNPRSASAHFELGYLLGEKEPDPAAAIYHYQQYLKLRPSAGNADLVKGQISKLKQDLVKDVVLPAATPGMQREVERLMEENRQLRDEVQKWRAYYSSHRVQAQDRAPAPPMQVPQSGVPPQNAYVTEQRTPAEPGRQPFAGSTASPSPRTHKVQSGETPIGIAKKYGVPLKALMAANPDLKPTRMQVGQILKIPAP